jgi:alpha-tubulin suppressor-like RCC1 family protein
VITNSGSGYCWGNDGNEQLGDGDTGLTNQGYPVAIQGVTGTTTLPSLISIGAHYNHTCAMDLNFNVYCWGLNTGGQIGNGTSTGTQLLPYQVPGLP